MSSELNLLVKWSFCNFFEDTNDINFELKLASVAESIYNSDCPSIEGVDLKMLLVVSVIKLLKDGCEDLNPQDVFEKLFEYITKTPYDELIKDEWISNFITEYKNNLKTINN